MAVVKAKFTRRAKEAKQHVRYIEQRPGRDRVKITRTLFGAGGAMTRQQAYRLISDAQKGSVFYKIVINPDSIREDTRRDLHLREITEKTMQALTEAIHKEITWVAAIHDDHTPLRHVHVLVVVDRIFNAQQLQAFRQAATEAALFQRQQLDMALALSRGRATRLPARPQQPAHRRQAKGYPCIPTRLSNPATRQTMPRPTEQSGGGSASPPKMCTCYRCGWQQVRPDQHASHPCPNCGASIHSGKKISLNLNTQEAAWER